MTNNELLLAISGMMDQKLEPIKTDIRELKCDVRELKEDVHILKNEVCELKQDVAVLKEDVSVLKQEVSALKDDVSVLKQEVSVLKDDVSVLKRNVTGIQITLENDMNPRLINIESCYTSTYERYQYGINQIESMQMDINLLKKVVTEHSEKINQTA